MDEIALRRDMEKGDKALKLLEDPLLNEAFDAVEKQIIHMFKSARIGDDKSVSKAKDLEYALSLVRRALRHFLENGELASHVFEERRQGRSGVLGAIWAREKWY